MNKTETLAQIHRLQNKATRKLLTRYVRSHELGENEFFIFDTAKGSVEPIIRKVYVPTGDVE